MYVLYMELFEISGEKVKERNQRSVEQTKEDYAQVWREETGKCAFGEYRWGEQGGVSGRGVRQGGRDVSPWKV